MTDSEVRAFLDQQRTLQVASINPDATPHLVRPLKLVSWDHRKLGGMY